MADSDKHTSTGRARQRRGVVRPGQRRPGLRLIEEIGALITHSSDHRAAAQGIVRTIAANLSMEVASIYVYDAEHQVLNLWTTTGLDPSSIGSVSMKIDEGLTGIVVQKLQPVMAVDALSHPRYKYFPETGEERYHSFLGIPVFDGGNVVGVLVVQTSRRRYFTPNEVRVLRAITVPVGGILARALLSAPSSKLEPEPQRPEWRAGHEAKGERGAQRPSRLTGLGASPGFGIGRAHFLASRLSFSAASGERRQPLRRELARLRNAVKRASDELRRTKERIQTSVPEIDAAIFDAQRLMLEDESFLGRIEAAIRDGASAEAALGQTVQELVEQFSALDDDYMKDRAADIKDIGQRLLHHLLGLGERQRRFSSDVVLVATDVVLSDLTIVEQEDLKGIVLATGGVTSHAAILARSLEIPTVVAVAQAEEAIQEGDHLIVDGNAGVVFVNPSPEVEGEYDRLIQEYRAFNRDLETLRDLPAETTDGHRVALSANIGLLGDIPLARMHGAEGIGLYRTEVAFLSHRDFLTEDEQIELYRRAVERMQGKPITIRTLDLGADKYPQYLNVTREENPFLGWRSIRISLEQPEVFKAQLRAILRISLDGPVRIMFPMISSMEELRKAKDWLGEAQDEVRRAGYAYDPNIPVGMMMEVPSAVYLAPALAQEVDFFSIGTNDLIQYVLAVDRNNRKVSPLYEPLHPAVLQCIASAVDAAKRAGKRVSICGEMAADPMCALVLLGLGLDDLSMGSFFIPLIKRLVRAVSFAQTQALAAEILGLSSVKEIKSRVFEAMREIGVIDVMEMYH